MNELNMEATDLNKIIEIQQRLARADFDLENFMQLVVENMQILTPATGVVIELVEGDDMVYRAAIGTVADYVGLRLKREGSISGLCVKEKKTLRANDTENDSRVNKEACRKVSARSLVVAPLFYQGKAIGVLKILSRSVDAFSEDDIQTLILMAGFIGSGLAHQIQHQELQGTLEKLQKANDYINEFVSMVTHELRTPLTSIQGSLALLANGALGSNPESAIKLIKIAESNSSRLIRLINDILDIQKFESGKMVLNFERIEIKELVIDTITSNDSYAEKFNKKILLTSEVSAFVYLDKDRIIQVLTNLLSNAVKFSSTNEILVSMQLINNFVKISVSNEGAGIPKESHEKMFQKFSQIGNINASSKGTGLGLSISKEIIEKHHGKIGFTSEPGKTTTFFFELPVYNEIVCFL